MNQKTIEEHAVEHLDNIRLDDDHLEPAVRHRRDGRRRVNDNEREERERQKLAAGLRGTHRQKVKRCFNDARLAVAARVYGNRRQRRAAQRAIALHEKGRKHVP